MRTQRFKPGDIVRVAEHSPLGVKGQRMCVLEVFLDPIYSPTGAAGNSARYNLTCEDYLFHELWDWQLEIEKTKLDALPGPEELDWVGSAISVSATHLPVAPDLQWAA